MSQELFSRNIFRELVFMRVRENATFLTDTIPSNAGFKEAVRYLEVNAVLYNFVVLSLGDIISGFDVGKWSDMSSLLPFFLRSVRFERLFY